MARRRRWTSLIVMGLAFALIAAACGGDDDETSGENFKLGILLVGPGNDRGYSQAHLEGAEYAIEELGLSVDDNLLVLEFANSSDTPGLSFTGTASEMIDLGVDLIIFNSDDMQTGAFEAARANPDVPMIWVSGDSAWEDGKAYEADIDNLANVWGQMIFGKMIGGCAAALETETGNLAYLGPLTNDETRRLVNSAYLGAKYCWENLRGETNPLEFTVTYIGFWFEIPGLTLDPTLVVNDFIDGGADVTLSGIDNNVALIRSGQRADAGETLFAVPYDFVGACDEAPGICLGVPYFNWGPAYLEAAEAVIDGNFSADWTWYEPDWDNINDPDTSVVGYEKGAGLSAANAALLDTFIAGLADGSIELYTGPLNWQDGSQFLAPGDVATERQIWYSEQCLEGIEGACTGQNVFG
jgi:simple sugar transport system substrate-binding protein